MRVTASSFAAHAIPFSQPVGSVAPCLIAEFTLNCCTKPYEDRTGIRKRGHEKGRFERPLSIRVGARGLIRRILYRAPSGRTPFSHASKSVPDRFVDSWSSNTGIPRVYEKSRFRSGLFVNWSGRGDGPKPSLVSALRANCASLRSAKIVPDDFVELYGSNQEP